MIRRSLLAFVAAAAASPAVAQAPLPPVDYGKERNWLCLPGQADVCSTPLPTTALNPGGYGSRGPSPIAKDPAVDCF